MFLLLGINQQALAAQEQNLPSLGDTTSGIISLDQERELGQDFLRSIRAQAPPVSDPLLQSYLEHLIYKLASHSQLQDRRLDLVMINNFTINAFAAPGGIVGVNLGLFLYGETEHEVSAILAHELAHLSQRHFARGVQAGKSAGVKNLAGLLAGIILIATTGSDAGLAAIAAGQGAAQSDLLRNSRARESEADRIGILTLADADMDPRAIAYMFERLERANRFNKTRIPEFLLTHPVTKNRISDSYNQTRNYENKIYPLNLDYQLMKARISVLAAQSNDDAIDTMTGWAKRKDPIQRDAGRYGLVLAHLANFDPAAARQHLKPLLTENPNKIAYILADASIHASAERYDKAIRILEQALLINTKNYPLTMAYANVLLKAERSKEATEALVQIIPDRPNDTEVWYLLAEAYGLANDIIGVHEARAEYFVLVGNLEQAIKQLGFAMPLVQDDFQLNSKFQLRIEQIHRMRLKARRS
ncbi:MAG: putative Zn-dependent protease [Candidatus Azotimanducaceae bacterium]